MAEYPSAPGDSSGDVSFQQLAWSPDKTRLAVALFNARTNARSVQIWRMSDGQVLFTHQIPADLNLMPCRKQVALYTLENGQPIIQVWDIPAEKLLFRCQPVTGQQGGLTWSPDGKYLAAYKNDHGQNMIHLWDAGSGSLSLTYGALNAPDALTWFPDSRFLALVDRRHPPFMRGPARDTVLRIFPVG